ncbi:LysR family transcriptional regulator [Shewanella sp. Isolate13]|uniref:LysR family transcriptional regulator n=1 Tax=Shewanella sp. Isolate13 TaxID=2908531 RepID=UPI001EFDBF59|nr:LysR family transcriptional regulator [Shewanella sp. Isolate13]MCG9731512.1 LysR family transcriptional regulator [Shewanella sp. Isolate13]
MDLNLLTTFLSVYKHSSITVAAEELGLTQPAVSAALKRLEKVVARQLFVREGRGIAATGAAVALANKIEAPLHILDSVEHQQQQLHLYCSESVIHYVNHIEQIQFSETPLDESTIFDDLVSQKVDLVIDVMSSKQASLIVETFHHEQAVCLTRRDHPRIRSQLTLAQYFAEQHIALKVRRNNLNTIENLSETPIAQRKVIIETGSLASMLSLCAESDYIAASTRSIAEKLADKLSLQIHEFPFAIKPVPLSMIYHRRYAQDPFHKVKRDQLRQAITQDNNKA